ncbi:MAG: [citrate (pro-3S)-lyase] ligase [Deltaproteobacteria bacterium]|jgi:[citrate (pro-3S)-lyase] ligase|nr:[citrate (pro-3S)-lyase] ligase [Deltaproteobacteria bacterium]
MGWDSIGNFELEAVNLDSKRDLGEVAAFLANQGLRFGPDLDHTVVLRQSGAIVATGSFKGEVIRNVAVSPQLRGLNLTAIIVTALAREQTLRGLTHFFVFTKPDNVAPFKGLGFAEIARVMPWVVLLETGLGSMSDWLQETARVLNHLPRPRAALVMNCDPFTKGHQALIRRAADENEAVVVFVVSEDSSTFPFADRFRLVKEEVKNLPNAIALPSGKYVISQATFPNYFLKREEGAKAQSQLDLTIFADRIAPALELSHRYVGEEPHCPVTRAYNQAMLEILPTRGVKVKMIPRIASRSQTVNASLVRAAWQANDWDTVSSLVPAHTLDYLRGFQSLQAPQASQSHQSPQSPQSRPAGQTGLERSKCPATKESPTIEGASDGRR